MQRFKRILVYVDTNRNSSAMLREAVSLASRNGAQLTVASCCSVPFPYVGDALPSDNSAFSEANIKQEKYDLLKTITLEYRSGHPELQLKVLKGDDAGTTVIRYVLKEKYDLLMLAVDRSHFNRHRMFSSMTMLVMRKCPCPVWVFTPIEKQSHHRILAAVDAGADSEVEIRLNQKILELSVSLAEQKKAELHVLHCWSFHDEGHHRRLFDRCDQEIELNEQDYTKQQMNRLSEVTRTFRTRKASVDLHAQQGDPSDLVPAFVKEHGIGVLVLGTVARKGVHGLISGNTAEKILPQVPCSILAVKPDGFISPVSLE